MIINNNNNNNNNNIIKMVCITKIYNKINNVKENLMRYVDIEISEHKILYENFDLYVKELYKYIENEFELVKKDIRNNLSQNNIEKYVEKLEHNYIYIKNRRSSEETNNNILNDMILFLEKYFENEIYNFCEDYYILFETFDELKLWRSTYIKNYAIIISHYIIEKNKIKNI